MTTDAAAHTVIDLGDVSVPAPPPVPRARPVRPRGLVAAAVVALALLVPAGAAAPARPVVAPPTVLKLDGQLAVDDDAVYAAPQPAGRLRAYDLATGAPRWTSTVTVHGLFFVRRLDDTVLVTVPEEGAQTVALDAATGAVRWRVRGVPTAVDAGIHQVVFLQPTANGLDNPDVDVSGVSAVDLTTGQPRWAYPPKGSRIELVLGVATDGTDQVVAGAIRRSGVETNLLDFATGGTVPLPPLGDYGALTLVGDLLLVGTSGPLNGPLRAYDRRTMTPRWTALDGQFPGAVDGCGRWLCVSTPAGTVGLDPADGRVRWRLDWSAVRGGPVDHVGNHLREQALGGAGDRAVAYRFHASAQPGVGVVQPSTGRVLAEVDGWEPLLSSYAPRLPLVRDVDGRIEVGVLDVGGGRFSRVGELTSTAANPCLASRLYVACRTGSGQVVAWRYTR